ncbi:hypothetical protein [Rhodococcus sp. NPDC049939]|uniref:hypothetical protein n=1 Tax=Rhodococcus sp. NPDC049939 TaxID=3155511 RepID=UPI0033D4EF1A
MSYMEKGLSLTFSDRRAEPETLSDINTELRKIGVGVWPLDLRNRDASVRALLAKPMLEEAEVARVKEHFLLPMDHLLEIVAQAGRTPEVPGGGSLTTFVTNEGYGYPQLHQVLEGKDYSRFDRFHVNIAPTGTGVDEVFQLLAGGEFVSRHRLDDGEALTLTLRCPNEGQGWLGTYSGVRPHIGNIGSATVGSKLLVQAFGSPEWALTYVGDD